jgi:predicted metal-dependent enzyme (double-stranded beta helix superfamily)
MDDISIPPSTLKALPLQVTLKGLGEQITNEIKNGTPLKELSHIISSYNGSDWRSHIKYNDTYSKTCAYANDFIEIIIITWSQNICSKIHDHPENGCLLRIMEGGLIEDVYIMDNGVSKFMDSTKLSTNQISYKIGNEYLHKISNVTNKPCISLHIYSPPNYKIKYYDQ